MRVHAIFQIFLGLGCYRCRFLRRAFVVGVLSSELPVLVLIGLADSDFFLVSLLKARYDEILRGPVAQKDAKGKNLVTEF